MDLGNEISGRREVTFTGPCGAVVWGPWTWKVTSIMCHLLTGETAASQASEAGRLRALELGFPAPARPGFRAQEAAEVSGTRQAPELLRVLGTPWMRLLAVEGDHAASWRAGLHMCLSRGWWPCPGSQSTISRSLRCEVLGPRAGGRGHGMMACVAVLGGRGWPSPRPQTAPGVVPGPVCLSSPPPASSYSASQRPLVCPSLWLSGTFLGCPIRLIQVLLFCGPDARLNCGLTPKLWPSGISECDLAWR